MRRRSWVALALVAAGFLFGALGRAAGGAADDLLATLGGACFVAALVIGISLLPVWGPLRARVVPMPGLFPPVPEGGRWCTRCGSRAPLDGACTTCGHAPPTRPAPSGPAEQKKQAAARKPQATKADRTPRSKGGPER